MSKPAISFVAFCTAGQERDEMTLEHIEYAERWCHVNDYTLEKYSEPVEPSLPASSASTLGCLYLLQHHVERARVAQGTVLILESLGGVMRAELHKFVMVLLELIEKGVVVLTLVDRKLYDKTTIDSPAKFFSSVSLVLSERTMPRTRMPSHPPRARPKVS